MLPCLIMLTWYCIVIENVKCWSIVGAEGGPGTWVMLSYYWSLSLFCFVLSLYQWCGAFLMFGFFCRSQDPIEIIRWVKLCVNFYVWHLHLLELRCVYFLCLMFSVRRRRRDLGGGRGWGTGSGGGKPCGSPPVGGKWQQWVNIFFFVCVKWHRNHSLFSLHSNYDRRYYKLHHPAPPTKSSRDPEVHDYGPEDPRALPK